VESSAINEDKRSEDFDRLLLLLASEPKQGFEPEYRELTRRVFTRLFEGSQDCEGTGDG
jgi:hypothetical protein